MKAVVSRSRPLAAYSKARSVHPKSLLAQMWATLGVCQWSGASWASMMSAYPSAATWWAVSTGIISLRHQVRPGLRSAKSRLGAPPRATNERPP